MIEKILKAYMTLFEDHISKKEIEGESKRNGIVSLVDEITHLSA
jgi:hypothetical protein